MKNEERFRKGRGHDFGLFSPKTTQNPKKCLLFQNLARCGTAPFVMKWLGSLKNDQM
jgi:hypothetical protein